jgi:hypothetical protein
VANKLLALNDKAAPVFAFNLDKDSALNLRYISLSTVFSECSKFILDPALVTILYIGLSLSI